MTVIEILKHTLSIVELPTIRPLPERLVLERPILEQLVDVPTTGDQHFLNFFVTSVSSERFYYASGYMNVFEWISYVSVAIYK